MRNAFFLLLFSLISFAGCSNNDNKGGGSPGVNIPADVSLNEKTLPAISDEQMAQSKLFSQNLSAVTGLEDHVFPVEDESWQDRQNRERRFSRLTPEQQSLARQLKDNCKFEQSSSQQGAENGYKAGTVVTTQSKVQNQHTESCPVGLLKEMNSRLQILTLNQEAQSGSLVMSGAYHMKTQFVRPEHLAATKLSVVDLNVSFSGGSKIEAGDQSTHAQMNGQGFAEFTDANLGRMEIVLRGESLAKEKSTRNVAVVEFRNTNQVHVFAFQQIVEYGQPRIEKAFIGNRQLTPEEIRELKFDDFAGSLGTQAPTQ